MKCKIDLEELRKEIRVMRRYDALYKTLKEELIALDHWKQQGRGNPIKAFNSRGKNVSL